MKKAISIMLVLAICLGMCACGADTKSNEIELTLDNYKQYLDVKRVEIDDISKNVQVGQYTAYKCYQLGGVINIAGSTTNFNYNNVKVIVRFSGTYGTGKLETLSPKADEGSITNFNEVVELTLNISGNGFINSPLITAPNGKALVEINGSGEIIGISGTVSPA